MDLAIGSTSSLQSLQDPTGAPPSQPKTSPSAAESVTENSRQTEDVGAKRANDAPSASKEAAGSAPPPASSESREAGPPPPSESGRGQLVDIAA